jgi:hypothetical protein
MKNSSSTSTTVTGPKNEIGKSRTKHSLRT